MSNRDLGNLFTPGDGGVPPCLAGRKKEKEFFRRCVKALKAGKPISRNMILYGPRGNGKTALLRYLQKETLEEDKEKLDILWETPDEMSDLTGLCDRLAGGSVKIQDWLHSVEVSVDAVFVKGKTGLSKPRSTVTVRELLRERCREKPCIILPALCNGDNPFPYI